MNHTDASAPCPSNETLTAFLMATGALPPELGSSDERLADAEMIAVSGHVAACDRCVEELRTASRRLSLAAEIPVAVPAAVMARANPAREKVAAPVERVSWLNGLTQWLRMPILVPAALAALALIAIVPRLDTLRGSDEELSRAVELRQVARVTADTAAIRAARTEDAAVLTTLVRGDRAVLVGEESGWYRVALADGSEGWVERSAFD